MTQRREGTGGEGAEGSENSLAYPMFHTVQAKHSPKVSGKISSFITNILVTQ